VTDVRFASVWIPRQVRALAAATGQGTRPALLCSYAFLREFENARRLHVLPMRDWVLDSGAYTAFHRQRPVDLAAYIDDALALKARDPLLVEIFALDVIGDGEATARNTETMWAAGIEAIPAFHYGEPWELLTHYAQRYPTIALGGNTKVAKRPRLAWAEQCFARVWPKKVHGFGIGDPDMLRRLPFHSADTSSWALGPCRYGVWRGFNRHFRERRMGAISSDVSIRVEVEAMLRLERELKDLWARALQPLEEEPTT
jgi:hypothetical protein